MYIIRHTARVGAHSTHYARHTFNKVIEYMPYIRRFTPSQRPARAPCAGRSSGDALSSYNKSAGHTSRAHAI